MSEPSVSHDRQEPRTKAFEAAARLTHARLELALAMQTLRASVGLTQQELADRPGVNQPAVAKLDRSTRQGGVLTRGFVVVGTGGVGSTADAAPVDARQDACACRDSQPRAAKPRSAMQRFLLKS